MACIMPIELAGTIEPWGLENETERYQDDTEKRYFLLPS